MQQRDHATKRSCNKEIMHKEIMQQRDHATKRSCNKEILHKEIMHEEVINKSIMNGDKYGQKI